MGFFSQNCKVCDASIKSPYDIPPKLQWQNDAVVITPGGSVLKGTYDGYGRVNYDENPHNDGSRFDIGGKNSVYHRRCWESAGSPTDYQGESEDAIDQGYFYDYEDGD